MTEESELERQTDDAVDLVNRAAPPEVEVSTARLRAGQPGPEFLLLPRRRELRLSTRDNPVLYLSPRPLELELPALPEAGA